MENLEKVKKEQSAEVKNSPVHSIPEGNYYITFGPSGTSSVSAGGTYSTPPIFSSYGYFPSHSESKITSEAKKILSSEEKNFLKFNVKSEGLSQMNLAEMCDDPVDPGDMDYADNESSDESLNIKLKPKYRADEFMSKAEIRKTLIKTKKFSEMNKSNLTSDTANPELLFDVKNSVKFSKTNDIINVIAIACNKQNESDDVLLINSNGGTTFKGLAYDQGRDAFIIEGIEAIEIGKILFGLSIEIEGCMNYKMNIPIPENILLDTLNKNQTALLQEFKKKYPEDNYKIKILQLISVK